jgi:hypothetical protein
MADAPKIVFQDISNEEWRAYHFQGGVHVKLVAPMTLHVAENGDHRILTADGRAHLIPYGWIHLQWQPKPGTEPFRV